MMYIKIIVSSLKWFIEMMIKNFTNKIKNIYAKI